MKQAAIYTNKRKSLSAMSNEIYLSYKAANYCEVTLRPPLVHLGLRIVIFSLVAEILNKHRNAISSKNQLFHFESSKALAHHGTRP